MVTIETTAGAGNPRSPRAHRASLVVRRILDELSESALLLNGASGFGDGSGVKSRELGEIQDDLSRAAAAVVAHTAAVRDELRDMDTDLEWDRLSVALYAPTNAGKSTLCEALVMGDGASIGTGEKDHTRESAHVAYGSLRITDTPGVEGAEGALRDEARATVARAHVLLVMDGTGKEPERGMLERLAADARRAGEVLSVLNIRGRPARYRNRKQLHTSNTVELEARIEGLMSQAFGSRLTGHVSLDAHLAFTCSPGEVLPRFQADRAAYHEIFGDSDEAVAFSGIGELRMRLDELARTADQRIWWGNTFKSVTAAGQAAHALEQAADSMARAAEHWHPVIEAARREVEAAVERARGRVTSRIDAGLQRLSNQLKEIAGEGIRMERTPKAIENRMRRGVEEGKKELEDSIHPPLRDLVDEIDAILERLRDRLELRLAMQDFELPDLSAILRDTAMSWGRELFDLFGSGVGVYIAALIHPILGVLSIFAAVARKLWEWFWGGRRRRRAEAVQRSNAAIETEIRKVHDGLHASLGAYWPRLQEDVAGCVAAAAEIGHRFERAADTLRELAAAVHAHAAVLTTDLLRAAEPQTDAILLPVFSADGSALATLACIGAPAALPAEPPSLPPVHRYRDLRQLVDDPNVPDHQRRRARRVLQLAKEHL